MMDMMNMIFEHIFMVLTSVILAITIAVPLAIVIHKKNFHPDIFVNIISLLQSFPSLGFFALLVPFVGIGMPLAIVTLFIYALMPIFINAIQGFKAINPEYKSVINSLNISKRDVFFKIELPLAMPFIINGVRLTTIYAISIATIATLVGAGGLGDLIYLGLQQLNIKLTILGIIPLLILTIIVNLFFDYLEKKMLPADQKNMRGIDYK